LGEAQIEKTPANQAIKSRNTDELFFLHFHLTMVLYPGNPMGLLSRFCGFDLGGFSHLVTTVEITCEVNLVKKSCFQFGVLIA
jgi:hypothetical protein